MCSYEKHKPIIDLPQTTAYLFFIHIISAYFKNYNYVIKYNVAYYTNLLYNIDFFSISFVPSNHHHVISETYNFTTVNHIFFVVHLMTGFYKNNKFLEDRDSQEKWVVIKTSLIWAITYSNATMVHSTHLIFLSCILFYTTTARTRLCTNQ